MNALTHSKRNQSGLTIVELMVSLAIGLILMGGMVQIFKTNKNAYRYNTSLAEMQDNGNFALEFVATQVGQIGFIPGWAGFILQDVNGDRLKDRQDMELWYYGASSPVAGTDAVVSDTITISTYADTLFTAPVDCVGTSVSAAGAFAPPAAALVNGVPPFRGIVNALVVAPDATGRMALRCNGVEVAEGIENMQIVYGVDTPDTAAPAPFAYDGIVDSYLNATQINAAPVNWFHVLTVRVALLVASKEESRAAANTRTYDLVGTSVTTSDRKQRNVYTTTIRLRNRCAQIATTQPCV